MSEHLIETISWGVWHYFLKCRKCSEHWLLGESEVSGAFLSPKSTRQPDKGHKQVLPKLLPESRAYLNTPCEMSDKEYNLKNLLA